MVTIVENWSRVIGHVEAWEPPTSPDAAGVLTVRVTRIDDVPREDGAPYKNLLAGTRAPLLRIQVPAAAAAGLAPRSGARITLDVRRGKSAERLFARSGHIAIEPPSHG